uniref:Ig-like domain-containing protein n=1 Tax=Timema cristinae TaxID=61476 RepID=A0A7R9CBX6_TIMCR|nr:unnamed protein product [Timema cristinae]
MHGVRMVLRNGTLVLLPFPPAAYRQDIHSTVYRCMATNAVGRIVSRDVQVRAVVAQAYKVEVEVLGASRGCTAVLRCVVPSFVKELVRVVSWLQEPAFYVYPSLQGDGKFHLLPTGELLVHNVEFSDQFPSYRCRTMHRLTRQVVVSSQANVRLTEHRGIVAPAIVEHTGTVHVSQDEGAVLLCVSQGCPSPDYRWFNLNSGGGEPEPVLPGPRTRLLGPILVIEAVTAEDASMYRCSASNAGGEASAELRLVVSTPLHVEVTPPMLSVHLGGSAEFRCIETSSQGKGGASPLLITWYKDGRPLPGPSRSSGDKLVVSGVGREDRGMYQCLVRRAEGETAQGAAELQLGVLGEVSIVLIEDVPVLGEVSIVLREDVPVLGEIFGSEKSLLSVGIGLALSIPGLVVLFGCECSDGPCSRVAGPAADGVGIIVWRQEDLCLNPGRVSITSLSSLATGISLFEPRQGLATRVFRNDFPLIRFNGRMNTIILPGACKLDCSGSSARPIWPYPETCLLMLGKSGFQ